MGHRDIPVRVYTGRRGSRSLSRAAVRLVDLRARRFSGLRLRRLDAHGLALERGFDETREERVRGGGAALEFGVELAADEVRMIGQLDHLDQVLVGGGAGEDQARRL